MLRVRGLTCGGSVASEQRPSSSAGMYPRGPHIMLLLHKEPADACARGLLPGSVKAWPGTSLPACSLT